MSSSDPTFFTKEFAEALGRATKALEGAVLQPEEASDSSLQLLLRAAVKFYAIRAEAGLRSPFPQNSRDVSTDDVMVLATDMLHALNVQLFELSMWQAMTGNSIAPQHKSEDRD